MAIQNAQMVRFATFEVDLRAGEVRKGGLRLKLSGQPFQVLAILLERPGEVVTREELQKRLWPDTFVDVDHNLNTAINKIRETLGDSAENPRFVETLARRGYRFIGPIQQPSPIQASLAVTEANTEKTPRAMSRRNVWTALLGLVVACAFVALGFLGISLRPPRVLGYQQLTTDRKMKGMSCGWGSGLVADGERVFFTEKDSPVNQVSTKGGDVVKVSTPFDCFLSFEISPDRTELLGVSVKNASVPDKPLWILSLVSGEARRVGNLTAHAGAWSPDGHRIVYATGSDYTGGNDIYTAATDGSDDRKLTRIENGYIWIMHWSRDGRVLRMGGRHYPGECRVWDVSNNGNNLQNVALSTEGNFGACWFNWTPDGTYSLLLMSREPEGSRLGGPGRVDISVLREKPSFLHWGAAKPARLTSAPMIFFNPVFSPDGKRIFAIGGLLQGELLHYDLKSHRLERYLSGISADQLAFSRDGKWVAYVTFPESILWRSRVDGSDRLQLTAPPLVATVPDWSADGTRIAFSGILPGGLWRTYVVSAQGGQSEIVSKNEDDELNPTWTPDGNSLIIGGFVHSAHSRVSSIDLQTGHVSLIPGSEGLRSPRISPDGRFIVALDSKTDTTFFLFDHQTQKWSLLVKSSTPAIGWPEWSSDARYVYFSNWAEAGTHFLYRVRIADHKLERVAGIEVPDGLTGYWAAWMIAGPDGSPILLRDLGTQEIYALDVDLP